MASTRIYQQATLIVGDTISLDQRASHHLLNVLRLRSGTKISLFNGDHNEYAATIEINAKIVTATITGIQNTAMESPIPITLVQGISRGDRMDWAIQKAVELGVDKIQPVYCERSMKLRDLKRAEKKQGHWENIVISACEQSGRCRLAEILPSQTLTSLFSNSTYQQAYILDPYAKCSLKKSLTNEDSITVLIGPEGGLSDLELKNAEAVGFNRVNIGPRILRTETAGIVALSIIQAELGDFR